MANVTFHGKPVQVSGKLPAIGQTASFSKLIADDLSEVDINAYSGKRKVLNIFPSIDTPTCATSVRTFNKEAASLKDTVVLCISKDLPFAQKRFCGAEGIENCKTLSAFRSSFGKEWGLEIMDSPLAGLMTRAVVVLDANNKVLYTELVSEIGNEPNYKAALKSLN